MDRSNTARTPQEERAPAPREPMAFAVIQERLTQTALPALVQRMIAGLDARRPFSLICEELGVELRKGHATVQRLVGMGVLQPVREETARRAAFDEQAEAFFASEVQDLDEEDEPPRSWADCARGLWRRLART